MAGNPSGALILTFLLTGLAGGAALAGTAPICEFKKQVAAGFGDGSSAYALFSGPSGTGKTMTAEVLAKELRMDLYKVDLSAVVSKYVGETEKNLAQLFDKAESENLILFFDEVDPLFGRRGDTKAANDRYGNLEADYLFRQIESHRTPVILTTRRRAAPKSRSGKPPVTVWFGAKGPPPSLQLQLCR